MRESPIGFLVAPVGSTREEENSSWRGYWGEGGGGPRRQPENRAVNVNLAFYPFVWLLEAGS